MGTGVKRGRLGCASSLSHFKEMTSGWVMEEAGESVFLKLVSKEQVFHRPLFKKHQMNE